MFFQLIRARSCEANYFSSSFSFDSRKSERTSSPKEGAPLRFTLRQPVSTSGTINSITGLNQKWTSQSFISRQTTTSRHSKNQTWARHSSHLESEGDASSLFVYAKRTIDRSNGAKSEPFSPSIYLRSQDGWIQVRCGVVTCMHAHIYIS